jgi:hypothetical protein
MTLCRSVLSRLADGLRRFRQREDGSATFEVVLVLPILMTIFMTAFESGYLMTRQILLERATDQVVRDIRLGRMPTPTVNQIRDAICDRTLILIDCEDDLAINLQRVSKTAWDLPTGQIPCVDRIEEVDPSLVVNPNMPSDVMLVRVCIIQDAIFPGAGLGLGMVREGDDGYALVAVSAFVNEP